ncbi:MAG: hypothetical protein DMG88_18245 [Acidobacteria bacterium]|nr:MAG: hypothetical protein DMG88_18245 [Acidobacteriota bacterium]
MTFDFRRLRKKSGKQIPRRLKPLRNDKIKGLIGTSELMPSQNTLAIEFFRSAGRPWNKSGKSSDGAKGIRRMPIIQAPIAL